MSEELSREEFYSAVGLSAKLSNEKGDTVDLSGSILATYDALVGQNHNQYDELLTKGMQITSLEEQLEEAGKSHDTWVEESRWLRRQDKERIAALERRLDIAHQSATTQSGIIADYHDRGEILESRLDTKDEHLGVAVRDAIEQEKRVMELEETVKTFQNEADVREANLGMGDYSTMLRGIDEGTEELLS